MQELVQPICNIAESNSKYFTSLSSPRPALASLALQKHFSQQGLLLPVFLYNTDHGTLTEFHPSPEDIKTMIDGLRTKHSKDAYSNFLLSNQDPQKQQVADMEETRKDIQGKIARIM